jgi:hypothetical protein
MALMKQSMRAHSSLFGYADVGTYGLAHSLLAWARCHLWCDQHEIPMIAPTWLHLQHRIGPLLRREHDNRQYHRLFHFPDYVRGLRRWQLLATRSRIPAETTDLRSLLASPQRQLVVFSNRMRLNEETHFAEIVGHGTKIRTALTTITKPEYRPAPNKVPHIAVHVRMGDFGAPVSIDALRSGSKNCRIPVEWYVDIINTLRRQLGNMPVRVYSDGTDEALAPLLRLPATQRSPKQASITDLLAIAQASLVVSSGSGFSMWGSYLGDAPRVCFRGQRFTRVLPDPQGSPAVDLEPECESGAELEAAFLRCISARLNSA